MPTKAALTVIERGNTLLRASDLERPSADDFIGEGPILVVLHGFTRHGEYLQQFGKDLEALGGEALKIRVLLFSYNSYRGLEPAVDSLLTLLDLYDSMSKGAISQNKVYLVGHSMGGLVARQFILASRGRAFTRGLVMLGTPNNGTLTAGSSAIKYLISYGEYLSSPMPEAQTPLCRAAMQLTKTDTDHGATIIDRINASWGTFIDDMPILTITGGKTWLRVGNGFLANRIANNRLQAAIGDPNNDGLVASASVNMQKWLSVSATTQYEHYNSYPEHSDINHSNLVENQSIVLKIISWVSTFGSSGTKKAVLKAPSSSRRTGRHKRHARR